MTLEQSHSIDGLILIGIMFLLYLLRNTPLGFLWKGMKYFLIVLFLILGANYAKGKVKDWWNK